MSSEEEQRRHRRRGVRLTDLDRGRVYRIGFVPGRRRWEVLGPELPGAVERGAGGPGHQTASEARMVRRPTGPRWAAAEPQG